MAGGPNAGRAYNSLLGRRFSEKYSSEESHLSFTGVGFKVAGTLLDSGKDPQQLRQLYGGRATVTGSTRGSMTGDDTTG